MPHFTLATEPGVGPLLSVLVGPSVPKIKALQQSGIAPPPPIMMRFLIDTGASHTCVDQNSIAPLSLIPTGSVSVHTPSTGANPVEQFLYDVSIYIHHDESPKLLSVMPVCAADFSGQPIDGLLGRDFLRSCLFVYDGVAQTHSIAF